MSWKAGAGFWNPSWHHSRTWDFTLETSGSMFAPRLLLHKWRMFQKNWEAQQKQATAGFVWFGATNSEIPGWRQSQNTATKSQILQKNCTNELTVFNLTAFCDKNLCRSHGEKKNPSQFSPTQSCASQPTVTSQRAHLPGSWQHALLGAVEWFWRPLEAPVLVRQWKATF